MQPDASGPGRLRPVRVLSIDGTEPVVVRFLGGYQGALLHWPGRRYYVCQGEKNCPLDMHKKRTVWKGWAAAEQWEEASRMWWPACLEITENLEPELRGRQLRGEVWVLTKSQDKRDGSPVEGRLLETVSPKKLRQAFDVKPILCRIYGVRDFPWGIANPVPPKLVLDGVADEPPALLAEAAAESPRPMSAEERAEFRKKLREKGWKPKGEGGEAKAPTPSTNGTSH